MSNDVVQQFKRLIKDRGEAYRAVEDFVNSNYPFSDEQKEEYLLLEEKAAAANSAFDKLSTVKRI